MASLDYEKLFNASRKKVVDAQLISQFWKTLKERPYISSDELNFLFSTHVEFQYVQHGVSILEHSDWVHTGYTFIFPERNGYILTKCFSRPLNSWAIKNPIVIIPSDSELEKIAEWRRASLYKESGTESISPRPYEVRNTYIRSAIEQLEVLKKFLSSWRRAQNPTEQSECGPLRKLDIQLAICEQNKNVRSACKALSFVIKSLGPECLRDSLKAVVAQEVDIKSQLSVALKSASH